MRNLGEPLVSTSHHANRAADHANRVAQEQQTWDFKTAEQLSEQIAQTAQELPECCIQHGLA